MDGFTRFALAMNFGAAIGAAIGVITGNLGLWLSIGAALGIFGAIALGGFDGKD